MKLQGFLHSSFVVFDMLAFLYYHQGGKKRATELMN
jgi:hypothetical protein